MNKLILTAVLTICMVGVAQADMFTQTIDFTSLSSPNGQLVTEGTQFGYTHDITALVSLPLDVVDSADLVLGFIDNESDTNLNRQEWVRIAFDGSSWTLLGDVDTEELPDPPFDVYAYLNTDGILNVSVDVYHSGTGAGVRGDVYLQYSALSVEYTPYVENPVVPVPAAVLLGMLGLSVAGVKLRKFA